VRHSHFCCGKRKLARTPHGRYSITVKKAQWVETPHFTAGFGFVFGSVDAG
jgi:hypothetical protein